MEVKNTKDTNGPRSLLHGPMVTCSVLEVTFAACAGTRPDPILHTSPSRPVCVTTQRDGHPQYLFVFQPAGWGCDQMLSILTWSKTKG